MIWGTWVEPNFEFHATDKQGKTHEHFCYAASEDELRRRLDRKGLTVVWIRPYAFSSWKTRARNATDRAIWQRVKDRWSHFQVQASENWTWLTADDLAAIAGDKEQLAEYIYRHSGCTIADANRQIDAWSETLREEDPVAGQIVPKTAIHFTEKIWQDLKWHLFDIFHGKCAYCESRVLPSSRGAVEHYRPKGKVDEDQNHPGYYWLAYDETNLLPSCSLCNEYPAKLTRFPVIGLHSRDARNVATEQPLLLNPYNRKVDPFLHLEFDRAGFSQPHQQSQYGKNSREIYLLDRPDLKEARFTAMQLVEQDWSTRIGKEGDILRAYNRLREELLQGEQEYAAARLWELKRLKQKTIEGLSGAP